MSYGITSGQSYHEIREVCSPAVGSWSARCDSLAQTRGYRRTSSSERRADFFSSVESMPVANLLHLADYQFQLFVFRIKVWRDAHSGAGPIIHNELAPD